MWFVCTKWRNDNISTLKKKRKKLKIFRPQSRYFNLLIGRIHNGLRIVLCYVAAAAIIRVVFFEDFEWKLTPENVSSSHELIHFLYETREEQGISTLHFTGHPTAIIVFFFFFFTSYTICILYVTSIILTKWIIFLKFWILIKNKNVENTSMLHLHCY